MSVAVGERRIVSVLMADVAGSTGIGETLGAERTKALFDELARLMRDEVERFGGTVAQLTGDGLFALFGAPVAHEDDPERAVRAAVAIQGAVGDYAQEIADAYGVDLALRVAVHTGPVVLPAEDAPPHERYNALGDTVNVAARLQAEAGPGRVAIGPETARQVRETFELDPLGELALKGKSGSIEAFQVVGEAVDAAIPRRPLVGRERELAELTDVLDDLVEGRGAIAVVSGEPGIGKSRLVAEGFVAFHDRIRFLNTAAVAYAREVPYEPVRELLRTWLGVGVSDPEARVRLELKAELEHLGTGGYPFLASLLGLALDRDAEETIERFARDSVQRQTHDAVAQVAQALARERPLCIVVDDLQWADEPTLELLQELLPLVDVEPLALVLLQRTDPEQPAWMLVDEARRRYRHRFVEIALEPLDADGCAALASSAAGATLSEELTALLAERAGGNPFFLEEALRDLVERGALRRVNAHLELVDPEAAVPALVQEALQARIDRLAPETREVVSLAAVAGKTFGMQLLERLVPRERLVPALSELQRADLVVEERRRPTAEYRFRHGLVQEAAYAALAESGRRALHKHVGDVLEELTAEDAADAFADLARHFAEADEAGKAADYLLRAGDSARAVYADEEAIRHYRRALPFLDRLGDSGRARTALFSVANAHHLAFDFEAANAAWQEAFARPEPPPLRVDPTEDISVSAGWHSDVPPIPGYAYITGAPWLAASLFRGLLRLERGREPVPSLSARTSVSADGCLYRFELRDDARWSDGEPVTAHDFVFTYERMRALAVPSAHLLEPLEDVRARGPRELELRLREPRPYFLYLLALAHAFPWPRHATGPEGPSLDGLVSNGPFVLAEHSDERALLRPNPCWAGPRGNVSLVRLNAEASARAVLEAWKEGELDLQQDWSTATHLGLLRTVVEPVPIMCTRYLVLRPERSPLEDTRVRSALALALDRERIVSISPLLGTEARGGMLPPSMPGHTHDLGRERDVGRARDLLSEAGFPGGRGIGTLRVVIHGKGAHEGREDHVIAAFAEPWREIGVATDIRLVLATDRDAWRDADAWVNSFIADFPDPDGFLGPLLEGRSFAEVRLEDPRIAEVLTHARALGDRDARLDAFRELDRLLVENAYVVPMQYQSLALRRRPWLHGIWTSPMEWAPLDEIVVRR